MYGYSPRYQIHTLSVIWRMGNTERIFFQMFLATPWDPFKDKRVQYPNENMLQNVGEVLFTTKERLHQDFSLTKRLQSHTK
jgi:hypothetical protein